MLHKAKKQRTATAMIHLGLKQKVQQNRHLLIQMPIVFWQYLRTNRMKPTEIEHWKETIQESWQMACLRHTPCKKNEMMINEIQTWRLSFWYPLSLIFGEKHVGAKPHVRP